MVKAALVVEDNIDLRLLLDKRLERAGLRVEATATGAEALGSVAESEPDIVFMDYRLPDMNGVDLLRHLRTSIKKNATYVIVTGLESDELASELGGESVDYIARKPLALQELKEILNKFDCARVTASFLMHLCRQWPSARGIFLQNRLSLLKMYRTAFRHGCPCRRQCRCSITSTCSKPFPRRLR